MSDLDEGTKITINEQVVTKEELEKEQKRHDIKLVQEGPSQYHRLQKLNG